MYGFRARGGMTQVDAAGITPDELAGMQGTQTSTEEIESAAVGYSDGPVPRIQRHLTLFAAWELVECPRRHLSRSNRPSCDAT